MPVVSTGAGADTSCVEFLQWALPRLGLRWAGFRTVRRQGRRRLDALGLADLDAYRAYLEARPEEWAVLEALTPITISRFYRDRAVFQQLERAVLPTLCRRGTGQRGGLERRLPPARSHTP
jgi:chemotaxis protein methyltransferase CheR